MSEKEAEAISQEEIVLKKGNTEVKILTQGAYVASFTVDQEEVLLPDQYFETPDGRKRRGGIPILFPQAGPITDKTDQFQLQQHGFARDRRWEVDRVDQSAGTVTLRLVSDDETKNMFPYDFEVKYTIEIGDARLRTTLEVTNQSGEDLPISPGFHPYFKIGLNEKGIITTNIPGFSPETYDWKTPTPYDIQQPVVVNLPNGKLNINSSSEFKTLMVWSELDRPHVCFEPWAGDVNAILHEDQRLNIAPGEISSLWMEISFEKRQE